MYVCGEECWAKIYFVQTLHNEGKGPVNINALKWEISKNMRCVESDGTLQP